MRFLNNPHAYAWENELSEVKHLSRTRKEIKEIPLVAVSEIGRAQTEPVTVR